MYKHFKLNNKILRLHFILTTSTHDKINIIFWNQSYLEQVKINEHPFKNIEFNNFVYLLNNKIPIVIK